MRGSRGALIILGIVGLSTLGCLPTPSMGGEMRISGKWHDSGLMAHIPYSEPYLTDKSFAGFSNRIFYTFDLSFST